MVWTHHSEANTGKWNDEIRFEPLPFTDKCSVWEIGANTEARDSQTLMESYPSCDYHAYEPIPSFFEKLQAHWEGRAPNMHLHGYGLADKSSTISVDKTVINAQSTFIGGSAKVDSSPADPQENNDASMIPIHIKSFQDAIQDAGGKKPSLLHMNCEGCEWDFLPQAVESGFIQGIDVIQVGTHNYDDTVGLGGRIWQLCEIRTMLARTHRLVKGVPFGWERWVIKK
jgi:FkbM family methyltransferase